VGILTALHLTTQIGLLYSLQAFKASSKRYHSAPWLRLRSSSFFISLVGWVVAYFRVAVRSETQQQWISLGNARAQPNLRKV
jgi:hypothetical protein